MEIKIHTGVKALIFDLDGTLSDSLPIHFANWNKIGKALGFNFDPQILLELTGRPTIEFAERVANDFNLKMSPNEIVRLKQETFHNSMGLLAPIKEIVAIVHKYHGVLPMAVGTGASRRSTELQLKTLGIRDKFEAIITAHDVAHHKPHPETFLKCAGLMNVAPLECQVFEDGELGIKAAKTAGMFVTDVRQYINYAQWIHS